MKKLNQVKVIWVDEESIRINRIFSQSIGLYFYLFYSDILRFDCLVAENSMKHIWRGSASFTFFILTK